MTPIVFGLAQEVRADAAGLGASSGAPRADGAMCVPVAVSEPSSLILLASGLAGLIGLVLLRKKLRARRNTQ